VPKDEKHFPRYFLIKILTLPLTDESVTHHSKLVPEKYKLPSTQCLGEYVCNLLLCRYVLYLHNSSLNTISGFLETTMSREQLECCWEVISYDIQIQEKREALGRQGQNHPTDQ